MGMFSVECKRVTPLPNLLITLPARRQAPVPPEEDAVSYMEIVSGRTGTEQGITFGRASKNVLSLSDSKISRVHLRVDRDSAGKITAYDLGSRSGSFINGKRFEAVSLRVGDQIRIGNSLLVFRDSKPKRKSIARRMSDWLGFTSDAATKK